MEIQTEKIAVLKFSRLELARLLAAGELSEGQKEAMRTWLSGETQEIVDGIVSVKTLGAGNGNGHVGAVPSLVHERPSPFVRKAMRRMRRKARTAQKGESCQYCGRGFKATGWRVSHEVRCQKNPDRVTAAL